MTNWFLRSKFKLACAAFLAGLGLLIAHMLTSEQWVSFIYTMSQDGSELTMCGTLPLGFTAEQWGEVTR